MVLMPYSLVVKSIGLRSNADNFTFEEMKEGVEFAKKYGAKVYVTTNIFAHNENIDGSRRIFKGITGCWGHGNYRRRPVNH